MRNRNVHCDHESSAEVGGTALLATARLGSSTTAKFEDLDSMSDKSNDGGVSMGNITTNDGTQIFYKDYGKGQPIAFSHSWPLTADDWDAQMLFYSVGWLSLASSPTLKRLCRTLCSE